MSNNLALRVSGLSKKFIQKNGDDFWALKDVSFEVQHGEVLGVIGSNGAGKSTLLQVLSSVLRPTSGSIEINGRITGVLDIGTGFHPDLTGKENIYLNAQINGLTKSQVNEVYDDLVEFSGLESFIQEPVKSYSSGMYMRLAFSIFAFLDPQILLLDEVFSVGDLAFQTKCIQKIEQLISEGTTVIMVAHNLNELRNICSRMIILEKGKIKDSGAVSDMVKAYVESSASEDLFPPNGEMTFENLVINDVVRILKVSIKSSKMGNTEINYDDDIDILFEYEKLVEHSVHLIASIYSSDDIQLIMDCQGLHNGYVDEYKPAGFYTDLVRVPKNTLNQGVFYVYVAAANRDEVLTEKKLGLKKLIGFKVSLADWDKENTWSKRISAPLRPKLFWSSFKSVGSV